MPRPRRECDHPPERLRERKRAPGEGNRGWYCLDCRAPGNRAAYADRQARAARRTAEQEIAEVATKTGTAPPLELVEKADCGGDHRYVLPLKALSSRDRVEMARICGGCPVRLECFQWVKQNKDFEGTAAGFAWGVQGHVGGKAPLLTEGKVAS